MKCHIIKDTTKNRKPGKKLIFAISICLIAFVGFIVFAKNYEIPLPYDEYRMSVEIVPAEIITNQDGSTSWKALDSTAHGADVTKDSDKTIDMLRIAYKGISHISETSVGRNINRKGKPVRVIYYCYDKTLWNSLFYDSDLEEYSESGTSCGTHIYGNSYLTSDYKPQPREIYYLPGKNLNRLDNISDEAYDALREKGTLVWSGTI